MTSITSEYVAPVAAVLTMAIGIGFVAVIGAISSPFTKPVAVSQEGSVATSHKYDFYSSQPVDTPLATPTEFSCYDPNLIPIWRELKKDKEFMEWIGDNAGRLSCSDLLETKRVDLNRDGKKEFLVRGKFNLCGATGNCGFWVFELKGSRAKKILSSADYVEDSLFGDQVQSTRTNGYSNILLRGHLTAAETSFTTYTFNGITYVESRCVIEAPKHERNGEGSMNLIKCAEFFRQQNAQIANRD